jgi:multiple sugar transport system substrate-binding protein
VSDWTVNVGFPGHANAAIDEVFGKWVLPKMFARAASGKLTLEDALNQGHIEAKQIYDTWRAAGKI